MATRPMAARLCTYAKCHREPVTGVVFSAANFCKVPPGAQVARAPLRIRLKPAACEHHGARGELTRHAVLSDHHARHPGVITDEIPDPGPITDFDTALLGYFVQSADQARPATRHR